MLSLHPAYQSKTRAVPIPVLFYLQGHVRPVGRFTSPTTAIPLPLLLDGFIGFYVLKSGCNFSVSRKFSVLAKARRRLVLGAHPQPIGSLNASVKRLTNLHKSCLTSPARRRGRRFSERQRLAFWFW